MKWNVFFITTHCRWRNRTRHIRKWYIVFLRWWYLLLYYLSQSQGSILRAHESFQLSWIIIASRALFSLKVSVSSSTSWLTSLVISLLADRLLSDSEVLISYLAFIHFRLLFSRLLFQTTLKNREIQVKMWIIRWNSSCCLLLNEILLVHLRWHLTVMRSGVGTWWYNWWVNSVLFVLNHLLLSLRSTFMNLVLHFYLFLVILRLIVL